jgi:hypothetical protein
MHSSATRGEEHPLALPKRTTRPAGTTQIDGNSDDPPQPGQAFTRAAKLGPGRNLVAIRPAFLIVKIPPSDPRLVEVVSFILTEPPWFAMSLDVIKLIPFARFHRRDSLADLNENLRTVVW